MPSYNGTNTELTSGNPYVVVEWAFNNAWEIAQNKSTTSDSLFEAALTGAGSAPAISAAPFAFSPNVLEPLVTIPTDAQGASIAKFYELSEAVVTQLAGLFSGYMDKYFPDETPYLRETENWLVKALTEGGTGIDAAIEDQIWQRDRARLMREASKAEEEVMAVWAARRHPLPPGAATYQMLNIRRDVLDKTAESSRTHAVEAMKIEVDNTKFAVETSVKLYAAAAGAATDYVKALSVGPASGMQVLPSITDSQAKLIGAAGDYYRARIAVEELKLKAATVPAEMDQQSRIKNAELVMALIKERVDAAVAAAQSMGTQAASALNSLHAAASVNGAGGTHVNYSYSNDTTGAAPTVTSA